MAEDFTITLTTQAEIEGLWSYLGAMDRADDDRDGVPEDNVWDQVCQEASDIAFMYLLGWYTAGALATSRWVRRSVTVIGAWIVSQRRGNPAQFEGRYERVMEMLQKVKDGLLPIPGLPTRADMTPGMSNYTISDYPRQAKIRVEPSISTGKTYPGQHVNPFQYYDPYA